MPLELPIDRIGQPIPPWCRRAFESTEAIARCVQRMTSALDQLWLRHQRQSPGTELLDLPKVRTQLNDLLLPLLVGQPWSVCQACAPRKRGPDTNCRHCHGRGWLTRVEISHHDFDPFDTKGKRDQSAAVRARVKDIQKSLEQVHERFIGPLPSKQPQIEPEKLDHVRAE